MSGCGTRIVLRFAVSATGGAHLCSTKYYLRFLLSSRRTSLAVSALKIVGIASSLNFPTIAFLLNIDPIYKTGALWQQRAGFVVAGQGSGRYPQSACLTKP